MMSVRLISYTKPDDELSGIECPQDLVAFCARVSNPSHQMNTSTSERLIRYLIKHQHWSPLEMVNVCLEITTTRDIARQILRHRSFSFQEFSQRYANPLDTYNGVFTLRDTRLQDPTNRQQSISIDNNPTHQLLNEEWLRRQQQVIDLASEQYKWAIDHGIAKEQARCVLPEGNTRSTLYMNGTLRSWVHYIELRSGNGTQKEHADIARECARVITKLFPVIMKLGT